MNILIPHTWLLEHLDTDATPEQIQTHLSLCGPSVEHIYDREGESVYDIEVTTNRVDSMCVRGIAREAAVILNQFGIPAQLKKLELPVISHTTSEVLSVPKVIDSQNIAARTSFVVLSGVERAPTPDWMAKRLRQIEQNVHDSVIDITNYITHELGYPCHAFDYDAIMKLGGSIEITTAKKGQPFTTLDGIEYTAVGGEIVFTNPKGEIIDLPAIKGTKNTSINENTKNVLLWIESLPSKKVRFASMTHAIRTVAAQLMEKNIDPHAATDVLRLGTKLYTQICAASVASELVDTFLDRPVLDPVEIQITTIDTYLGLELPLEEITALLTQLGCEVTASGSARENQTIQVQPPTFRPDLQIPADIVEEVARIYGYHNLPSTLMATQIPTIAPQGVDFGLENRIKRHLTAVGWSEVYTYSMVSEQQAAESGHALSEHLKLNNHLTDDKIYLRRSLIPSLVTVFAENPNATTKSIFEIANVYHPKKNDIPSEQLHLSMLSKLEYRSARAQLELLLKKLFIPGLKINQKTDTTGELIALTQEQESVPIGTVSINKSNLVAFDIIFSKLLQAAHSHPFYSPKNPHALIIEDLTFTLPKKTSIGEVLEAVQQTHEAICAVTLISEYKANRTLRIEYQFADAHISVDDVAPIRAAVVARIEKDYAAQLVGSLQN